MSEAVRTGEFKSKPVDRGTTEAEGSTEVDVSIGGEEMTNGKLVEEIGIRGVVRNGTDVIIGDVGTLYGGLCDDGSWSELS